MLTRKEDVQFYSLGFHAAGSLKKNSFIWKVFIQALSSYLMRKFSTSDDQPSVFSDSLLRISWNWVEQEEGQSSWMDAGFLGPPGDIRPCRVQHFLFTRPKTDQTVWRLHLLFAVWWQLGTKTEAIIICGSEPEPSLHWYSLHSGGNEERRPRRVSTPAEPVSSDAVSWKMWRRRPTEFGTKAR